MSTSRDYFIKGDATDFKDWVVFVEPVGRGFVAYYAFGPPHRSEVRVECSPAIANTSWVLRLHIPGRQPRVIESFSEKVTRFQLEEAAKQVLEEQWAALVVGDAEGRLGK